MTLDDGESCYLLQSSHDKERDIKNGDKGLDASCGFLLLPHRINASGGALKRPLAKGAIHGPVLNIN
jgi:hypothetical protein